MGSVSVSRRGRLRNSMSTFIVFKLAILSLALGVVSLSPASAAGSVNVQQKKSQQSPSDPAQWGEFRYIYEWEHSESESK